ncbi:hypothetical protein Pmani_024188 [Petrolisthes manimaculis]|uniref:CUB domain-containing protein n=1 Tax=Petrolisthes manimaculis TaxID=1843537 RepID=A0AAE1TYY9_9EUCA|nr:hypothetical protein Pmani_024188 [Petrolisthes manimaculis]
MSLIPMLSRVLVAAVVAVGLVGAASLAEDTAVAPVPVPTEAEAAEAGTDREGKLWPMMQIVTFENGPCESANGDHGVCFSQKECEANGGTASGTCANGYGVCCVLTVTCDGTISINGSVFQSPGFPAAYNTFGMCMVTLNPPSGTCQILLDFINFELAPPLEGDCTNDTFVVMGANQGSMIPTLCGTNTGQHLYIDVDNSQGPFKLVATLSSLSFQRHWKVKVTFLDEFDPCLAPNRCLQYFKETMGTITSFNFAPPTATTSREMLNMQTYSICFAYIKGFCDIGISFSRLDLGNVNQVCDTDYVAVGAEKFCGDTTSLSVTANATGPITILVVSDDDNSNLEEGFSLSYTMMSC